MSYIGTPPNQQLRKITSQSFNGDGSTTVFTLNRSVDNGESLEVFVDNVQQEPGTTKSYTAAGTSLTFSEAPQTGTGNIYVIYRGVAEVTTRLEHDPNQALQATTGTFSSALSATTGTFTGNVDINGNELILDADADTSITADTDDQIDIKIGGSDVSNFTSDGLKMISGKGIDFSLNAGTQETGAAVTSELFHTYEEGTWTPTVSSGTIGIETGSAHYVRVGKLVVAHCRIDTFSDTTSTTQIRLGGLPYPTGTSQVHAGVGWSNNAIRLIFFYGGTVGNSYVDAYGGGSNYDSFKHNDLVSTDEFLITLTYITQ